MRARSIPGQDGAFRARLVEEGWNPEEHLVAMGVLTTSMGDTDGCRVLKVGVIQQEERNSVDFWTDSPPARVEFKKFDLSEFGYFNGQMMTPWKEMEIKIKRRGENGTWTTIKAGEREAAGYGDLVGRLNMLSTGIEGESSWWW